MKMMSKVLTMSNKVMMKMRKKYRRTVMMKPMTNLETIKESLEIKPLKKTVIKSKKTTPKMLK
jgi:hypothetical protein